MIDHDSVVSGAVFTRAEMIGRDNEHRWVYRRYRVLRIIATATSRSYWLVEYVEETDGITAPENMPQIAVLDAFANFVST